MAKTTVEIRREVLERFPHFTLVDYRGNDYPLESAALNMDSKSLVVTPTSFVLSAAAQLVRMKSE